MSSEPLLIVQCGNTFPEIRETEGDFDAWFRRVVEQCDGRSITLNAHQEPRYPEDGSFAGILITGSPAMVTDRAGWSESLGHWLVGRMNAGIPILGVCYGHQLLAHALGGEVDYQPGGREIGSLRITLKNEVASEDPLFSGLPPDFYVHLTHSQSVMRLPAGATCLASSSRVSVQAAHFGQRCWGVQFHPEFNETIMQGYLDAFARDIDPSLHHHLGPHACPMARAVLERFIQRVVKDEWHE